MNLKTAIKMTRNKTLTEKKRLKRKREEEEEKRCGETSSSLVKM